MQQSDKRPSKSRQRDARPSKPLLRNETRSASFQRRLKAAGLSAEDDPPADKDELRRALTRRISMFINDWDSCPEPVCRRQRGCFAPHDTCSNAKSHPPVSPEQVARAKALVSRTAKALAAQCDAEEFDDLPPVARHARRAARCADEPAAVTPETPLPRAGSSPRRGRHSRG